MTDPHEDVFTHLHNQKLPPVDPMSGVNGRIGHGGGVRSNVRINDDHVPGFYAGLGKHWPEPDEV